MNKLSSRLNQNTLLAMSPQEFEQVLKPMNPVRRVLLRKAFRDNQVTPAFVKDVRESLRPIAERRKQP